MDSRYFLWSLFCSCVVQGAAPAGRTALAASVRHSGRAAHARADTGPHAHQDGSSSRQCLFGSTSSGRWRPAQQLRVAPSATGTTSTSVLQAGRFSKHVSAYVSCRVFASTAAVSGAVNQRRCQGAVNLFDELIQRGRHSSSNTGGLVQPTSSRPTWSK